MKRIQVGSIVELLPRFVQSECYSRTFKQTAVVGEIEIVVSKNAYFDELYDVSFLRDVDGWTDPSVFIDGDEVLPGHGQSCKPEDLRVILDPL